VSGSAVLVWLALTVALTVGAIILFGRSVRRDDALGDLLGMLMMITAGISAALYGAVVG